MYVLGVNAYHADGSAVLLRDGELGLALFNVAISNVGGLLMVWVGYSLAKIL